MSSIASLEEEKTQYAEQSEIIKAQLKEDPDNAELLVLQQELDQMISLLDASLSELKAKQAPPPKASSSAVGVVPAPPPAEDQWSRENHPILGPANAAAAAAAAAAASPVEEELAPTTYSVNDNVMAKWVSGDKAFYAARITAITGSSTARVYIVKFKDYNETDKVRDKDLRPMSKKRKADESLPAVSAAASSLVVPSSSSTSASNLSPASASPVPPPPPPSTPVTPGVISAAANMYSDAAQALAAHQPPPPPLQQDDASEKGPRKKKVKAKKELEAGKNKWQEFSKSKGMKSSKKDSMFRTPEGINGRVGFTGSGQAMRKDPTRSRHVYQQNEDQD